MKPLIRFKEFNSDWQEKKLGEISTFLDSTRKPIKESDRAKMKGEFPYYGASGIIDYVNDYIFDDEIILLGEDGENIISRNLPLAFRVSGKCWVNNHAHVIKPFDNIDIDFLAHSLERISYKEFNSGTAQPKLNQEVCKSIPFYIPHQSEQKKIASFLSAVDEKITQLTKKIELLTQYKKGVMQKIFSQELRFKADDGGDYPNWAAITLGNIADFFRGTSLSKSDISQNGNNKCIHYGELFTSYSEVIKSIKSKTTLSAGFFSEAGDILMPSSDVTPLGLARASCIFDAGVILGGDINIIRLNSSYNPILFSYLINSQKKKVIDLVSGTTVKHIYIKDIKSLTYVVPSSLEEQTKIANFLLAIDEKIQNTKAQLGATKQYKQGLLQQMFV